MPSPDQIVAYAAAFGAALFALAKVAVPVGLVGSAVELFGKRFGLPRVEAFGDKVEKFCFDLPGLLGK